MMPNDSLMRDIQQVLTEKLLIDVPSVETDLIGTGALDSLRLAELLVSLEEQFQFHVAMEQLDLEDLRSVTSIASLIRRQASAIGAAASAMADVPVQR